MSMLGNLWNEHLLPRVIDVTCSDRVTRDYRERAIEGVRGEVLEVGFGSGTNLRHYPAEVERLYVVEPADVAWKKASKSIERFGRPVERIGLDGAVIDLPDASVDAVVSSFTMCTIPDLDSALAEMHRVLRPDGRVHFVEHGLAPDPRVAAKQRQWQPRWGRIAGGCHLDRDIPALVTAAGFELGEDDLDAFWMPGLKAMRPFSWLSIGHARPA